MAGRRRAGLAAEAQRKGRTQPGIEAEPHGDRVPERTQRHLVGLAADQLARMLVLSEGAPPPALSDGSATTTGAALKASAARRHLGVQELGHGLAAHGHQLLAELGGERVGLGLVAVRHHQHAARQLRHVGVGEAVHDRDREDAVLALHRLDAVDEGAHQRQGRRVALDLAAVVERHHRLDLAAQGGEHEIEQVLARSTTSVCGNSL
jgi:hypothetical protein